MEIKSVSENSYARVGGLTKAAIIAIWIAAFLNVAEVVLNEYIWTPSIWRAVDTIQMILLASYTILTLLSSWANFKASKLKVKDAIDNAFGTEIGDEHSTNYYDNEEVIEGAKKLLYNTAESCFFSHRELQKMKIGMCIKALIPLFVLCIGLIIESTAVIRMVLQLSAILVLLVRVIKFYCTISQLNNLLDRMFVTLKHKNVSDSQLHAESINYTIEYEALMVWYGTKIPDKIYHKMNKQLTSERERMRKSFVI